MGWFTGVALYLTIWWTALFAVLPWGIRHPENPELGHVASAPVNPRLGLKFLVTSGISAVIWLILYVLIRMDVIDFRGIAAGMMHADLGK